MRRISVVSFVFCIAIMMAGAQSFNVGGIQYKIVSATEPRTVEVTYKEPRYEGDIVVPSETDYLGNTYEVIRIGNSAFERNYSLTSVTVPNTVTSFGLNAFAYSSVLKTVNLPPLLVTIENFAFEGCASLTSIVFPETMMSIGNSAFEGCSSLLSISIPASVTSIGGSAFRNCTSMTSINVDSENTGYASSGGVLYDKDKRKVICCPAGKTFVSLEGSVREIESYAFSDCSLLNSISIPGEVTRIGFGAFYGCSGLSFIDLPNMLEAIEGGTFEGCTGLTSITIPASVMFVQPMSFVGCTNMTDIFVDFMNFNYTSLAGVLFDSGVNRLISCPPGRTSLYIPNTVNIIDDFAVFGCTKLTSIDIPNSVMEIRNHAFDGCTGLLTIILPNSVNNMGSGVFSNCSGLNSVTLSTLLNEIPGYTFSKCTNLTSFMIPNSVKTIGSFAFENCEKLSSIEIPNSVTKIESNGFRGCIALTSLTIPESVTSIGSDLCRGCVNLTEINVAVDNPGYASSGGILFNKEVTTLLICPEGKTTASIPNTVTTVGAVSFMGCAGLTSIDIPASVTVLGGYAFSDCTGLTLITCNIIMPPTITETVFRNVVKTIPLYVPEASVADYIAASYWNDFTNILPIVGTDIGIEENIPYKIYPNPVKDVINITGRMPDETVNIYNMSGDRVLSVRTGYSGTTINLSLLPSGIYLVEIISQNYKTLKTQIIKM